VTTSDSDDDDLLAHLGETADDEIPLSARTLNEAPENAKEILRGEAQK
jgi:hypothetical protein